jgi:hypothetical protein
MQRVRPVKRCPERHLATAATSLRTSRTASRFPAAGGPSIFRPCATSHWSHTGCGAKSMLTQFRRFTLRGWSRERAGRPLYTMTSSTAVNRWLSSIGRWQQRRSSPRKRQIVFRLATSPLVIIGLTVAAGTLAILCIRRFLSRIMIF